MKVFKGALLIGLFLLIVITTYSARSQTGITINNADSVMDAGMTGADVSLSTLLSQVLPRVVFEFANSSRLEDLPTLPNALGTRVTQVQPRVVYEFANSSRLEELPLLPNALSSRVNQVAPRVVFEFANTDYRRELSSPTGALSSLLAQVSSRVIFEFANSSRQQALSYPLALLNDTVSPQISNVSAVGLTEDSATLTWTTNEFANSEIQYGVASGNYTNTVSDALYVKDHSVIVTGLTSGQTYYFQITSIDQSGNTTISSESNFAMQIFVFLPMITKNN